MLRRLSYVIAGAVIALYLIAGDQVGTQPPNYPISQSSPSSDDQINSPTNKGPIVAPGPIAEDQINDPPPPRP